MITPHPVALSSARYVPNPEIPGMSSAADTAGREDWWIATDPSLQPAMKQSLLGSQTGRVGFTRIHMLAHGLDSAWRLVASSESSGTFRSRNIMWSFTAHLLASDKRWAVAIIPTAAWDAREDGVTVIARALRDAVVEESVAGLVRRFTTDTGLPSLSSDGWRSDPSRVSASARGRRLTVHPSGWQFGWALEARMDVLEDLLMRQDFEGRAAEEMLLDLSMGAGALAKHRANRRAEQVEYSRKKIHQQVEERFRTLAVDAARRGILNRGGHKEYAAVVALRRVTNAHFVDDSADLDEGFDEASEQVYRDFFGDVLGDARAALSEMAIRYKS